MKLQLILLSALVAIACGGQIARPAQSVRFPSGQTYVYEYSSRAMTGIPELQAQYAGLEIRSEVYLQALSDGLVAMKMAGIRVGKHNGPVSDQFPAGESPVMDHQVHTQFQKELTKPIRFVYQEGRVKAFEADQSEPEWSLNMKKAFLSLLQVDLNPKKIIRAGTGLQKQNLIQKQIQYQDLTIYPVYEEGIGGLCESVYELHNSVDPQAFQYQEEQLILNVTKTRNYDNCLTEPTIVNDNYDVRGCPWVCRKEKSFSAVAGYYPTPDAVSDPYMSGCPCGKEPHESPVDAYAFFKYNISLIGGQPVIEGAYGEGKTVFADNGQQIVVITQQNLTYIGQVPQQQIQINLAQIQRPQRHQELSFRIPKPQLPGQPFKKHLDIPYYHLFGPIDNQELAQLVPELLDSLASQISSEEIVQDSDKIGQNAIQLVNAMAVLQQHQLEEELFQQVAQEGAGVRATPKQQIMRKLYLDALPLAGSNDAALAIKSLILSGKVTTWEAKELVEAVPQNLFLADTETIDAYLELFQSPKVQARRHLYASAAIAFGKMVKEACVKRQATPGDIPDNQQVPHPKRNLPAQMVVQEATPSQPRLTIQRTSGFSQRMRRSVDWEEQFTQDVCNEADVTKYVTIIGRLLQTANQFHKKVVLIETLAHMGHPQVLQILAPYINGYAAQNPQQCPGYVTESAQAQQEECDFIRQVAIYALSHVADTYPKQVASLVTPVYSDQSEAYEIRIAAFTTLIFADPEKQVLERIASELYQEPNRQIKSFVYSTLQTVANISAPCFQQLSQYAQQAVAHAPQSEFGYQYSKMIGQGFFDQDKDFGLYSLMEWTSSNVSRVPRAGYLSIGQSAGPFQDEILQIGFQAKGMEELIQRAFGPQGLLQDMFEAMHAKSKDRRVLQKRSTDSAQQLLEALKSKLNLVTRSEEEPKATIFFKLFDRTSYYALDKHYIHQVIDNAQDQLKDVAQALMQGQQFHYVKLVMPANLYKVLPSELGLPVVVTHRHPLIISLKVDQAKLQIQVPPKTVFPTGANLTAAITPALFYSSHSFAFVVNPSDGQTYGSHVQKTTHAHFPAEVSVGFSRPKALFTWSVIPKSVEGQNQEILYHETRTETFVAKAAVSGAPDADWLQDAQPIKTMATPFQYEQVIGQQEVGVGLRIQSQSENVWGAEPITSGATYEKYGTIAALVQSWRNPELKAREVHVQLEQDRDEPVQGYDFSIRYKWVEDSEQYKDDDDSDESSASDESDSDQSDESSESQSSESNESNSDSDEDKNSSDSSDSSDQSNSNASELKKRIARRMQKTVGQRQRRSVKNYIQNNYKENQEGNGNNGKYYGKSGRYEENESSDESSNESGSKSFSKSGEKDSSQSSSSESNDSSGEKKKQRNGSKYSSKSAKSSESDSSSSQESDESRSFEDQVFDYEDVMQLILGQDFQRKTIKKITKELIQKTEQVWTQNWDEDYDQSSSDESNEDEANLIPQTIAHDIAFTAVSRGPRPTYYAVNALYVHTYDHRIVWLKTDGYIKAPKGVYLTVPTLFCADAVLSYPTLPNEFYYEPQQMSQKARLQAQIGWGAQCQSEGGIIVKGVMEQTEDHVVTEAEFASQTGQSGASGAQVRNWYVQQCVQDRAEGQSQSYACERAIISGSYFNQLIVDVKYAHVPKQVQNLTYKADLALKYALYNHLEVNPVFIYENETQNYQEYQEGQNYQNGQYQNQYQGYHPQNQIRLVAQFSQRVPDVPLANLEIRSPHETQMYARVHVPYVRPISSLLPTQEVFANLFQGYDARAACHVMEDFVRTYDNVTFKVPESTCQYLLTKDGSAKERFAVFVQQLEPSVKTKTITVFTSGSEIKLLPPQQQNAAQVIVDGHPHDITYRQPVTLIGGQKQNQYYAQNAIRIYLRATPSDAYNPIIVLESDLNQFQVLFDGKSAKVILLGGQYAGKTVGLCGDNNDEAEDEFQGPDQCVYQHVQDFANSYALSGQHCEQIYRPQGPKRCPAFVPGLYGNGNQAAQEAISSPAQQYQQPQYPGQQIKQKTTYVEAQGPNGQSVIQRQEIAQEPNAAGRSQVIQAQANAEELAREQQLLQEKQMQRQNGEPVNHVQKQTLYGGSPQQQQLIQRLTTNYIERDEMICFAVKPQLTCIEGVSRALSYRPVQTDFHCLPKATPFTQQLVQEARLHVIKQLANKRVDLRQVIQVPVQCEAIAAIPVA